MRKIAIVIFCTAFIAVGGGCITCMKDCPAKDVVFSVGTPFGDMPVKMKKGHLNPDKEKESWIGAEEFEKQLEQSQETEEIQNPGTKI